jgi:hypothetical protein
MLMRRSVAYNRAKLRLSHAAFEQARLHHQLVLRRRELARAMMLGEDQREPTMRCRQAFAACSKPATTSSQPSSPSRRPKVKPNLFLHELTDLRAQRVQARRNIERAPWIFPDAIDRRKFVEAQVWFIRSSERRWQELHALLHRPPPTKPVRLR